MSHSFAMIETSLSIKLKAFRNFTQMNHPIQLNFYVSLTHTNIFIIYYHKSDKSGFFLYKLEFPSVHNQSVFVRAICAIEMSFEKFRILFWKNWTLQRRKPISGLFQIAFPIVIVVLATWGRSAFGNQFDAFEEIIEEKFELDLSDCTFKTPLTNVFFAPDNVAYRTLIEGAFGGFQIQGFPDPGIMWDEVYNQDNQTVGIILTTSDSEVAILTLFIFYYR